MKVQLLSFEPAGEFQWRWPSGSLEHFAQSWCGQVAIDREILKFRHALGQRHVYERPRTHSVTWIAAAPMVEGVETDDYPLSKSLFSLLRRADARHARSDVDVPDVYNGFHIVQCRDEIQARYSPHSLGVKIREDNIAAWAAHAAIRSKTRRSSKARANAQKIISENPSPAPAANPSEIVRALLEYGQFHNPPSSEVQFEPTPDSNANDFVAKSPLAFLFAVIADQGVLAEIAWRAPYELSRRLGHFDIGRMIDHPEEVAAAIKGPPALHRFPNKYSLWIIEAAQRVVDEYGGDAGQIWNGGLAARLVHEKLDAFPGIGQKKAAMAVEILNRDLLVPITEMHGSDVAYDVHVRRVFMRTGLAQRDDLDHIVSVARRLHPDRPGELDQPAWLIGRGWCKAGTPNCTTCPITLVCPKIVYRI